MKMADKEKILELARKRFQMLQDESSENRTRALENFKFVYNIDNAQWGEKEKTERQQNERPFLTHNKLRKFVSQLANRERDQRMSQKVKPVDDVADPKIADIMTGYIHSIEYQSKADIIYAKAGEQALAGGLGGYLRILTQYQDDSFDQEIVIKSIENPFSVHLDPLGNYGFIGETMSHDDFKVKYPNADPVDFNADAFGEGYELWYEDKKVHIREYFYKEPKEKIIAQVIVTNDIDKIPEIIELKDGITVEMLQQNGFEVLKTRTVKSHTVKWCKITGDDIIEGIEDGKVRDWVGKDIPIIEVKADEVNIAGKIYKQALIEDGKDPQRLYNYGITSIAERASLAPKAPYIVTSEMIAPYQKIWDSAYKKNLPYLPIKATPLGIPKRQDPPALDVGLITLTELGDKDIQDTIGMFESTFGQKSNERTGKAILARSSRSDMGTFHFVDNLKRAIQDTARQLIDIIPKVVDTQRMLRIRNYEGEESLEEVNVVVVNTETGKPAILNDLSLGRYDVEADVKIWSTRREEAAQGMREAMQYAPMIAPIIAKYYFKYSDFPGANDLEKEINQWLAQQQAMAQNEQAIKSGVSPEQ